MPHISPQNPSPLADFVTANELFSAWPFSKASLYNWSRNDAGNAFPKPVKFGPRRYLWRRDELNSWLVERGLPPLPSPVSE